MDHYIQELRDLECRGQKRILRGLEYSGPGKLIWNGRTLTDLASNDYLGLSGHPALRKNAVKYIKKYGTSSSASRLLSGDLEYHHELENALTAFKGKPAALSFGSGYLANMGVLSSVIQPGDLVFADRLIHASLIDGLKLRAEKFYRFAHNDTGHLRGLLMKNRTADQKVWIVTESVFSMDGDTAPLRELCSIAQEEDCRLYLDEAHAAGLFGSQGGGLAEQENCSDQTDIVMGTFGKALGSYGAYVALSNELKQYIVNKCRTFIFSTALPPPVIGASLAALKMVRQEPERRKEVLTKAEWFRAEMKRTGYPVLGETQIVPVVTGNEEKTLKISKACAEQGLFAPPIRPPAVPEGECRIRFSVCYHHKKADLQKALDVLNQAG